MSGNADGQILKSGFVSIVGRPNSGKSTLLNQLVGNKVSIVTPKAQTTRNVVRGITSDERGQIVFLDTPGIHKPLYRMNERMMRMMLESLRHIDVVMLVVDVSIPGGRGAETVNVEFSGVLPRWPPPFQRQCVGEVHGVGGVHRPT